MARPDKPKTYNADSYKYEAYMEDETGKLYRPANHRSQGNLPGVTKSIDWSKHKNNMIKQEAERPEFVKIDYLRFENKSQMLKL